jgi:hypothetical protein
MAQLDNGRIFVEANPDIYDLEADPIADLEALADSRNLSKMVDWGQSGKLWIAGTAWPVK